MEVRPVQGRGPSLELTSQQVGAVTCARWSVSTAHGVRTTRHVADADPGVLMLWLGVAGTATLAGTNGGMRVGPGDLTVMSSSRPWRVTVPERHETLLFCIPRVLLEPHAARLESMTLTPGFDPIATGLATPALARVGEAAIAGDLGAADAGFAELVVNIANVLGSPRLGAGVAAMPASGARGAVLLARAKAYIERRLEDPDLGPGEVAASQHISIRYLQKLFQSEGTTMLAWTRTARLRRARRDLGDPAQAHRTIAEIAASRGFRHPGHFRRAFREEFGLTPARFRRETLHGA
jgi:AraC-like DNA-binding protein